MTRPILNIVLGAVMLGAFASSALAQQSTPPAPPALPAPPAPPAQFVVEEIQSGWLFSPDARVTDLGGETGALAGGYVGRITDRQWVFGAGGYVLTNRDRDFKLAYGGPVGEWLFHADRRIGFGVRALVGAGTATLPRTLGDLVGDRVLASTNDRRRTSVRRVDPNSTVAVNDDFLVAEPQVNVMWNITPGQRLVFGVGYRAVANAPLLGDELNGVSGSVSFQIGGK